MPTETRTNPLAGPILTYGFAAVVAMWIAAFITHHPAIQAPPLVSAIIVISLLFATCVFAGGSVEGKRSWVVGVGAGLVAALVTLLSFGSYLSESKSGAGAGLKPSAFVEALGFIGLGGAIGLIGGLIGSVLERALTTRRKELIVLQEPDWLSRFATVTSFAIAPLLFIGGWVTTSESGMAVPDWPGTYSANMFLYPIGLMTRPGVFLEHSHRLFGAMVGLTTLVLVIYTFVSGEKRLYVKIWAICLLILVIAQGVLGGVRVTNQSAGLALIHGITAQVFFALTVAFAAITSTLFKSPLPKGVTSVYRTKVVCTAFLHITALQLIFGAIYRHFRQPHAMYAHIAFSLLVVLFAILSGFEFRSMLEKVDGEQWNRARAMLRRLGVSVFIVVSLQFALGWAALGIVGIHKGKAAPPVAEKAIEAGLKPFLHDILPTVHQANGALLLALATLGYVWLRRFWVRRSSAAAAPSTPA